MIQNVVSKIMILSLLTYVLAACSSDEDLGSSVYIPDDVMPGLPAYTEWGYNTFGANYERDIFVYADERIPFKVVVNDTATLLMFIGQRSGNYYGLQDMSMHIALKNFMPDDFTDLIALHDTVIQLDEPLAGVRIYTYSGESPIRLLGGQLRVKRVQNLFVDDQFQQVILSGYFDLQFVLNGEPMSISDGRFDLAVDGSNFFVLK